MVDDDNQVRMCLRPARIPLRLLPDPGARWRRWRRSRRNMRNVAAQSAVVREIENWLTDLILPDGLVEASTHEPRDENVAFAVLCRDERRELEFEGLLSWTEIDARKELECDVLDALRESSDSDPRGFLLSGYAESCWLNRSGPFD